MARRRRMRASEPRSSECAMSRWRRTCAKSSNGTGGGGRAGPEGAHGGAATAGDDPAAGVTGGIGFGAKCSAVRATGEGAGDVAATMASILAESWSECCLCTRWISSSMVTAFRPRSAYVMAARSSSSAAPAAALFRSSHSQPSSVSTSAAEPPAPRRYRNAAASAFSAAQLAASSAKMGSRAPPVRAVEVRAAASTTAHVKKMTVFTSVNSPNRAD
mmetsp:Transcript_2717/g.9137  ORF Transcript_2717/g.9137 Transcript_2717/m.9137 type:complete len:217 (+) Transcript_2717:579-1229(+)